MLGNIIWNIVSVDQLHITDPTKSNGDYAFLLFKLEDQKWVPYDLLHIHLIKTC